MSTDTEFEIYKLQLQSADNIDERRDLTTRMYGMICVAILAASTTIGFIHGFSFPSAILFGTLSIIAIGWRYSLKSLIAKLDVKNELLIRMEEELELKTKFLTKEREVWKSRQVKSHSESIYFVVHTFVIAGIGLAIFSIARAIFSLA